MSAVAAFAPAKINLYLHVGPPRADGYHPLDSVAMFADCGDTLRAARDDALGLRVEGPFAAALADEKDNLVLRAARLLADHAGVRACAALTLEKRLPVASGIGGGSADAAAALRALNVLWAIGASQGDLCALARKLGADVAVCVASQTARMRGVGDAFDIFDAPVLHAVLVNPGVSAPTPAVYRRFDSMGLGSAFFEGPAPHWPTGEAAIADLRARRNDLTAPATAEINDIGETLALLRSDARVRLARMSGSGATCFGLVEDAQRAQSLAASIQKAQPHWWTAPVRLGEVDAGVHAV